MNLSVVWTRVLILQVYGLAVGFIQLSALIGLPIVLHEIVTTILAGAFCMVPLLLLIETRSLAVQQMMCRLLDIVIAHLLPVCVVSWTVFIVGGFRFHVSIPFSNIIGDGIQFLIMFCIINLLMMLVGVTIRLLMRVLSSFM